ncbi:hypothetical protein V6N11_025951 [Hibiscus sabdariffa]|uniref:Uncharacterized protein n=1 Tax=Hibiscus sabdariffa TaxID=183260 RepID=A0ABR2SU85_9ROSI
MAPVSPGVVQASTGLLPSFSSWSSSSNLPCPLLLGQQGQRRRDLVRPSVSTRAAASPSPSSSSDALL